MEGLDLNLFKHRVFVATPAAYGEVSYLTAHALLQAQLDCLANGIYLDWRCVSGMSYIQMARNLLVHRFLEAPVFTHLMWLDNDLGFDPTAIRRMVERNVEIIAGVYRTKENLIRYPYVPIGDAHDGVQEALGVPGGFLLVKRHVVEKLAHDCSRVKLLYNGVTHRVPYMFDLTIVDEEVCGEDGSFCNLLRVHGFPIFVETNIDFLHVGIHAWAGNLHKNTTLQAADMVQVFKK